MLFTLSSLTIFSITVVSGHRQLYFYEAKAEDQISDSSSYHYTSNLYDPAWNNFNSKHFSGVSPYLQQFPHSYESYRYYYPDYESFKQRIPEEYSYWANLYKDPHKYRYGDSKDLGDFENYQYVNDKGNAYNNARHGGHGKTGDAAYKSLETYDKGSKGKYDNQAYNGFYNKEGSDKDDYHGSSQYFSKNNEGGKGYVGESYSDSSRYKKGSKTTGYHKIHNKNEYKKDHSFYDESDKRGHLNKYAHGDSYHEKNVGDFEKGGRSNVGFQKVNQGENGSYDNGHYDGNDSKFSNQQGKRVYQEDYSKYDQGNGNTHEKQFGFGRKEVTR